MFALRVDVVLSAWCRWITFFGNSIICKTISGLGTLPEGSRVTRLARGLTNVRTQSLVDLMHNAASGPQPATKRPARMGRYVCVGPKSASQRECSELNFPVRGHHISTVATRKKSRHFLPFTIYPFFSLFNIIVFVLSCSIFWLLAI